jgi:hypothetical protein
MCLLWCMPLLRMLRRLRNYLTSILYAQSFKEHEMNQPSIEYYLILVHHGVYVNDKVTFIILLCETGR